MGQTYDPPSVAGGEIHGAERCDFKIEPIIWTPAVVGPVAASSGSASSYEHHNDIRWDPGVWPKWSSEGLPVFTEYFFIKHSEVHKAFDTPYRQHNEALKYLRDTHETAEMPWNSRPAICGLPYTAVAEVVHE